MRAFCLIGVLVISLQASVTSNAASREASTIWSEAKEQTACKAMPDNSCIGRYGFTIKDDGTFTAGPSDQGTKVEGRIETGELQQLGELIGSISSTPPSGERSCERLPGIGGVPGMKDQVDMTLATGLVVRLYELGNGQICYFGSRASAQEIHNYVRRLMTKYYPIPFSKR